MTLTDNGLKAFIIPLEGYINEDQIQARDNLFDFIKLQQVSNNLPFGRFSITHPTLTKLGFLSSDTRGLGIGPQSFIKGDTKGKSYIFKFNMYFGGTF